MSDVKPWEPVAHSWYSFRAIFTDPNIADRFQSHEDVEDVLGSGASLKVTLANGQIVIVRALSEERKAARAFERRVARAVEANR